MIRKTRVTFIPMIAAVLALTLGGCGYLAKQGAGLVRYQSRAKNIDKILAQNDTAPELRDFLLRVQDIRAFAIDSVGLARNKNYTKYVRADRDYMADVIVASRDDTFDLHKWWFPIVGSVSYKGYFNRDDAVHAAEKLKAKAKKKGRVYDVHIGRADAFSTLGFFSDPIYSFMINYGVYDLASLIIHEQAHATIWIKGQTQLNEEIATFIGDAGGLWYVRDRFGENSEEYRAAVLSKEDHTAYINLMRDLYNELRAVYDGGGGREQKLADKERIFEDFRSSVSERYDSLFRTDRYAGLKTAGLNNAVVASRMTYNLDMSLYYELYEFMGGELDATVEVLRGLRKVKKDHKEYLKNILGK